MTIITIFIYCAIAALVLTALVGFVFNKRESWLMSYAQNFCGSLFIFSGYVKAVDPMGTAFKLEQYFAEFKYTFEETWLSFIAPMFPWLAEHGVALSVIVVVFEIVLGIMLIIGDRPKFTAWAFLLLVLFFTGLTGFTYLTGHVPSGTNFFEFGAWGDWVETNMRVTDCGCFGDFLKLKPKVSFQKDLFLLLPAFYFVFRSKKMHQLFTPNIRNIIVGLTTVAFLVFCIRNFVWDEPIYDFRPFHAGADVRNEKVYEMEQSDIANKVTAYNLTNKASGESVTLAIADYLKEYKNYPKAEWELEQVKGNPPFETSKISDFAISDLQGNDMTSGILDHEGYSLMVLTYKLKALPNTNKTTRVVSDTTWNADTVLVNGMDEPQIVKSVGSIDSREVVEEQTLFEDDYVNRFKNILNPVVDEAQKEGIKVIAVTAPSSESVIDDLRHATQSAYPFYTADDLLIKTMQRSNPGLVLWKDGRIIQKWHIKKLPPFAEIKAGYMQ